MRRLDRSSLAALVLYCSAFIAGITASPEQPFPSFNDLEADKYLSLAAWDGSGVHAPLQDVASRYRTQGLADYYDAPVARTPGGILVMSPAAFVPTDLTAAVGWVVSVFTLVVICWLSARIARLPAWVGGAAGVLLAQSPLLLEQYRWASGGMWAAGLVVAGWYLVPRRAGGVILGLASVMRAWPIFIVAALLRRDTREVALWALGTIAIFTGLGLLLPGVSLTGTIDAAIAGTAYQALGLNQAPAKALGLWAVPIGAAIAVVASRLPLDGRVFLAAMGGLVASPLVWPWYWLALMPAAGIALRFATERFRQLAGEMGLSRAGWWAGSLAGLALSLLLFRSGWVPGWIVPVGFAVVALSVFVETQAES